MEQHKILLAKLTVEQINAILPIIQRSMTESMTPRRIEQECIDACELAGCPIDLAIAGVKR